MKEFQGVCYDGPCEGQKFSHYAPYYRVALYRGLGPRSEEPGIPDFPIVEYAWSYSLRKWVVRS